MKKLLIALLLPMSALSQRVIIDKTTGDTTLLPCSCPATIMAYKPPNNANRPPVGIVNDNMAISSSSPIANIILDASCSYDPEGNVLRFFWRKVSGPTLTLTDTNKAMCYASNMNVGTYNFEVRVVDPVNSFVIKNIIVVVKSAK